MREFFDTPAFDWDYGSVRSRSEVAAPILSHHVCCCGIVCMCTACTGAAAQRTAHHRVVHQPGQQCHRHPSSRLHAVSTRTRTSILHGYEIGDGPRATSCRVGLGWLCYEIGDGPQSTSCRVGLGWACYEIGDGRRCSCEENYFLWDDPLFEPIWAVLGERHPYFLHGAYAHRGAL